MSYRTIEYTVYNDKITPNTLQNGGIAGDDNAVRVKFNLQNITLASTDIVRIEISNGAGGFNSSQHLTVSNSSVYYDLPLDVTSAGGTALLHLVICSCKNNVEQSIKYSYPAKIYFEKSGCGSVSYNMYKQGLSGLALECKSCADNAKSAEEAAVDASTVSTNAAINAEESAQAAESSANIAANCASSANSAAASAQSAVLAHDSSTSSHSDIRTQLSEKAPFGYVDEMIQSHNNSDNAHETLKIEINGLNSELNKTSEKLSAMQAYPSYEKTVSGGAIQRIDDVSPLEHTTNITVHGTTDENGNGVKDPKVNIYGKNLFVFKTKSADGYVFSGSTVTVNDPTQHYGFNSTSTVNLPAGTYTFSCNVSGERTYNDDKSGFSVFYKIGDIEYGLGFSNFISGEKRVSKTFTLTEPAVLAFSHVWFSEIPPSADLTLKVQLEVGGTATEFEEYKEPQMFFAAHEFMQGQSWNLSTSNTVKAVSPTMTVIVTDDNSLVNTVDVTYNADLAKAITALSGNLT